MKKLIKDSNRQDAKDAKKIEMDKKAKPGMPSLMFFNLASWRFKIIYLLAIH